MSTKITLITLGILVAFVLDLFFGYLQLIGVLTIPSLTANFTINDRAVVLIAGVGLIGLRWFLVHRKRTHRN